MWNGHSGWCAMATSNMQLVCCEHNVGVLNAENSEHTSSELTFWCAIYPSWCALNTNSGKTAAADSCSLLIMPAVQHYHMKYWHAYSYSNCHPTSPLESYRSNVVVSHTLLQPRVAMVWYISDLYSPYMHECTTQVVYS